ncbi:MAG: flagellar basal body L-ring protein FlgH [Phycisphaerae bacterium]|nr:flagellar basal body L-ring protein FlgH [Phycisphaerae bacterium]
MNRKRMLIGAMLIQAWFLSESLDAGSIWAKRDKNVPTVYADDVARGIGDVLTIKIAEESTVDNKSKRELQKETSRTSDFDGELGIDHILPSIPGMTMSAEASNSLSGKADYKDERSFEDRVSVVVLDVLPNGNLVVLGTRDRSIAGDIQAIEVSGIVRPSDIAFDNTIKSEQVANFHIVTKNSGVSAPYTRTGWVGRIFDLLWPW